MERMWRAMVALMTSIIEASAVDLPEPVGPVTSTKPCGRIVRSPITGGRFRLPRAGTDDGIALNTAPMTPRWRNALIRNRPKPFKPCEKSSSRFFSNFSFC